MEIGHKEEIINESQENNKEGGGDDIATIKYMDDIHSNQLEIVHLLKEAEDRKRYIRQVKEKLYRVCRHNFNRDSSAAFDDIFKWKCSKCHLYKGEYSR